MDCASSDRMAFTSEHRRANGVPGCVRHVPSGGQGGVSLTRLCHVRTSATRRDTASFCSTHACRASSQHPRLSMEPRATRSMYHWRSAGYAGDTASSNDSGFVTRGVMSVTQ